MASSAENITQKNFKEWTVALTALSWSHSYWSTLLYEMLKVKFTESIPTLGVGGGWLYCNPTYFADPKFSDNHRVFMIAHEISHEMFFHPDMMKQYLASGLDGEPFDMTRFNVAADYVINDMLIAMRVGQYHKDWLHSEHFTYLDGVLDVYRRLKPKDPPPGGGGGEGEGEGEGEGDSEGGGGTQYDILDKQGCKVGETREFAKPQDTHMFNEESPFDQNDWKQAVAGAHQQAKGMGHGSSALDAMVAQYIETQRNWKQELRDYVVVSRGRETLDWKRSHKRKMHERGIFVPTKLSYRMGDVLFIFDVSGSVSREETIATKSAALEIFTDCKPKSVRAMSIASYVITDDEFTAVEDFMYWMPSGTGGTDMEEGFRKVVSEGWFPELAIVLTDGYTPFTTPPPFPVVWISTSLDVGEYPYGHAIKLDIDG